MAVFYYSGIQDAMAESLRRGCPLIVLLHAKPDVDLPASSSATANSTTADDLRFLPSAYVAKHYHITSSASADGDAPEPLLKAAPAFFRLAAAGSSSSSGTESTSYHINPAFPLGAVSGGTAQRLALEATVQFSGLSDAAVFLRLTEGEADFVQFAQAMAGLPTGPASPPPLPRAYLFTPNSATRITTTSTTAPGGGDRQLNSMPPLVLFQRQLTPRLLTDYVRLALSFPMDPVLMARQQQQMLSRGDPTRMASQGVGPSGGQGYAFTWKQSLLTALSNMQQQPTTTTRSTTAAASSPSSSTSAAAPSASGDRANLAQTAAVRQRELQVIHMVGLPFQRAKTVFVTTPSMTLKTIWQDVTFTLQRLQKELEQCEELDQWEKFGGDRAASIDRVALGDEVARWFAYASTRSITLPARTFQLRILPPANSAETASSSTGSGSGDTSGRLVPTAEEAQKIHLVNLPNDSRIQVIFTDEYAALSSPAPPMTTTPSRGSMTAPSAARAPGGAAGDDVIECDGDVCRRVPRSEATAATQPTTAAAAAALSTPTPTTTSTSASGITLRCALPTGETLTFSGLDPAVATLAKDVRPGVEARLGHSRFHFVQAYPLQHFSVGEDEPQTLSEVGLKTSRAVRVALEDDAPPAGAQAPQGESANAFGRLRNFLGGRGSNNNNNSDTNTLKTQAPPAQQQPPQRTFHSMREMLDAQEKEENDQAAQRARMESANPSEPDTSSTTPQGMQAILQRFAQQMRQQQQQSSPEEEGEQDPSSSAGGGDGQRPGKSQRYSGNEGGRRLGGGDGGTGPS